LRAHDEPLIASFAVDTPGAFDGSAWADYRAFCVCRVSAEETARRIRSFSIELAGFRQVRNDA
jgi:hypothetical protein